MSIKEELDWMMTNIGVETAARATFVELARQRGWEIHHHHHDEDRTEVETHLGLKIEVKPGPNSAFLELSVTRSNLEALDFDSLQCWQEELDSMGSLIASPKKRSR